MSEPETRRSLGVSMQATQEDIKKAYRSQGKLYDPNIDSDANAETKIRSIIADLAPIKRAHKRCKYIFLFTPYTFLKNSEHNEFANK